MGKFKAYITVIYDFVKRFGVAGIFAWFFKSKADKAQAEERKAKTETGFIKNQQEAQNEADKPVNNPFDSAFK